MRPILTKVTHYALCLISCVNLSWIDRIAAGELTELEAAGKRIYTEGINRQGREFDALVGETDVALPSTTLPCAGCHGKNAEGGEEGGVRPPPLAWSYLSKHYGHAHANGRRHQAFTTASFARNLREGLDPGDNRLDTTMPRYALTDADIEALVSYLKLISAETAQGISESSIRIGTLVPRSGPLAGAGEAMLAALKFHIDRQNARGGLYGRKLELVVESYTSEREKTLANLQRLVEEGEIFALVSPFLVGIENEGAELSASYKIPVVAPFSQFHGGQHADLEYMFYLRSGFREQARALLTYFAKHAEAPGNLLLIRPAGVLDGVGEALATEAEKRGWTLQEAPLEHVRDAWADLVETGRKNHVQLVFFYGSSSDMDRFLSEADRLNWHPMVTLPEALIGSDVFKLPVGFSDRLYLTHPDPVGKDRYRSTALIEAFFDSGLSTPANLELQLAALNAAQVFNECLKRTGRDISHEKFVAALESLNGWDSDIGPRISFGVNRRVASQGSRIVSVDIVNRSYTLVSAWLGLD